MANHNRVTHGERREFLKALGVAGSVGVSGVTLGEVQSELDARGTRESTLLEPVRAGLSGGIDAELVATQQAALTSATEEMTATLERGLPTEAEGVRNEFAPMAAAGRPLYDHLAEVGFFDSAAEQLPEFNKGVLSESLAAFVEADELTGLVSEFGMAEDEAVDVLSTVIGNADRLENRHWVADGDVPRSSISFEDVLPSATQATAGGVLLWLEDLDQHLWQKAVLVTEEVHADAVWHGRSMAVGFSLMSEAAKLLSAEGGVSEHNFDALLTTSFAVQAISQGLLPSDVYWLTEGMRTPRAGGAD